MRVSDIAIAGCGIAGLAAALLLHRQGHRVTLYERFAEPRPVGSGMLLQPTGLAVLARLGLAETIAQRGAQVDALLGLNTEGEPVLEADYADLSLPQAFGLGIHRASLFDTLYSAALAEGIQVVTGHEIAASEVEGKGRRLSFADGSRSPVHDLVIDAAGLGSRLVPPLAGWLPFGALWATIDWPREGGFQPRLLEQRYCRAEQMVGLLPLGEGKAAFFWSLRGEDHLRWQESGMAAWHDEVCSLWPACENLVDQLGDPTRLTFARYAHRTSPAPIGERIVHIGDAWHAASPQLGQGANMALLDAWALANAIGEADDLDAALGQFLHMRQGHVRLYQWMTWWFTPPFQSSSVWPAVFRDHLMAPGSRLPPFRAIKAAVLSGLAGSPLARLGLEPPDYPVLAASASSILARASSPDQS